MLIEPVFISWREDRLPNKLVNMYQKVNLFQAIEKKSSFHHTIQPIWGCSCSFSPYGWREAICLICFSHLSLSWHGVADPLLFEISWLFLQKISCLWCSGHVLLKSPVYFYGPAVFGIRLSAIFSPLLRGLRREEVIMLLSCSVWSMCMARDFPFFSANPWEEENFSFLPLLAFQHRV